MELSNLINMVGKLFSNQNSTINNINSNQTQQQATTQKTQNNNNNNNNNNNYRIIDNSHNYPPMFEDDVKKVNTASFNMPIYPEANQNINVHTNNSTSNSTPNFQDLIKGFLSNPEALNIIKQIIPILQTNTSSNGTNILSNLFSSFTKKSNNTTNISDTKEENSFDIDDYIKIDDC